MPVVGRLPPSLSGAPTSGLQPPYTPLVPSGSASLGTVDEQRPRIGRQLVQLDLERVGVVLNETGQGLPVLLDGASPAHSVPPDSPAHLRRVHVSTLAHVGRASLMAIFDLHSAQTVSRAETLEM
ncbi:hypothetical protein [Actinomadura sp. 3N407]|uniref:hypothetical protein n=1 Tax=Actinomadura sp. 3N407 TaxID=3457423 RepID=UPI003FCE6B2B